MRVLITGALGHIGSRLIRDLPAAFPGAEIAMLDNLSTQRYCSLFDLPPEGHYRFIQDDVLSADLTSLLEGVEVAIHLAAITDAAGSFKIREQVEQVNYAGTERVARACAETGSRLIYLSTTSVYGTQADLVDEDCPIDDLRPQSPYAEAKLKAEQLLSRLGQTHGLRFVTLRFGTIFGTSPGMRFHTAINKFCWQAALGQPITVWRTAMHQMRPYLDLSDGIEALMFILQRSLFDCRIYNVLTANATVYDIVEIIRRHVPDVAVEYVDTEIMNQLSYHVSNQRFSDLGFTFRGSLEQGIGQTIALLRGVRRW